MLKKQNYRESDQIVTIWSYELGKIRVLGRALRLPKSKLSGNLQDLSVVDFEVTGKWPTIISAQAKRNFKGIRTQLAKMAPAFYATELMLKTTADEHPNPEALDCLLEFLGILDAEDDLEKISVVQHGFTIKLLSCLGFSSENFSGNSRMNPEIAKIMQALRQSDLAELRSYEIPNGLSFKLKIAINQLLEFVLERKLESQVFLNAIN